MKLLFLFAGAASAVVWDFTVTCADAPRVYTIDGMANRELSVDAGDSMNFNFAANCIGLPMNVKLLDGTQYSGVSASGAAVFTVTTNLATPQCLIYYSTAYPATMSGTITVVGGTPCAGASPLFPFTLVSTPVITPVVTTTTPVVINANAALYPTTTTTTLYPIATAATTVVLPPACLARACPILLPCALPAVQRTPLDASGCPGCAMCVDLTLRCCPAVLLGGEVCRDCALRFM